MKTYIMKISSLIISLSLLISITTFANKSKGDYSKPYKQTFQISEDALLKINSEFTDIKAFNWDKDEISVEVTVTVDANSQEKAEDKFNRIRVNIKGNSSEVFISTELESDFFGRNNNNNIDIEVLIYYPEHIKLDLENEFGNSIFENISGSVNVEVSYGDFRAKNLSSSDLDLEVEFGKIEVNRFQSGKVDVAYGGFTAQVAAAIQLKSEFSSNQIEIVNHLELNSAYDKLLFGEIDIAFIESEFSSLRVDNLKKYLELNTSYGSFNLKDIDADFELIKIESEFTGVDLFFSHDASFAFEATVEMGDFKYPKDVTHITFFEKEMMELSIKGYIGNAKTEKPRVILSLEMASAKINLK